VGPGRLRAILTAACDFAAEWAELRSVFQSRLYGCVLRGVARPIVGAGVGVDMFRCSEDAFQKPCSAWHGQWRFQCWCCNLACARLQFARHQSDTSSHAKLLSGDAGQTGLWSRRRRRACMRPIVELAPMSD